MARWEFKLPDIGEGITEGEIVGWLVAPGDAVKEDQPMVEVMTDKATVTITAPKAGMVVETHGTVGEIVAVHAVLVVFELDAFANEPAVIGASEISARDVNGATRRNESRAPAGLLREVSSGDAVVSAMATAPAPGYFEQKPLATPATRKLARDMSVDLRHVRPTGPQGRVTKGDLESFVRSRSPRPLIASGDPTEARNTGALPRGSVDERVPLAGLRRRIAQKMALSKQKAAHFTFVEECDVTDLKATRGRLTAAAEERGVKLTFLPFIVKAVVAGLKKHPALNSSLDESTNEMVFRKSFHIGIATATDSGLVVPVVKDADKRSILDIAREIERLAREVREGHAKVEDLHGSTFTITSLGAQSGFLATPIINFPEAAILGVHRIKQRAVVKNGQIAVGDVMLLSLSFDHRLVDGHVGAAFAYEIIKYLEEPERLMLEMA